MRLSALAVATIVLVAPCPARAEQPSPPTAEEAKAFIGKVETELAEMQERFNRAYWIGVTFITDDTTWLKAKADADLDALHVAEAKQAAAFDHVDVDPVTRRELEIVKRNLILPPPAREGAGAELATLSAGLDAHYSTSKVDA